MRYRKNVVPAIQSGFSLLELTIVTAILVIVMGVVTAGLNNLQKRSNADFGKVDATQETRQFMDQIINDIHQAGFPGPKMFCVPLAGVCGTVNQATDLRVSRGLISATGTQLHFDADLDGSGTVYAVYINLIVPASGLCPCILQRGILTKQNDLANNAVPYYTEVNNVMNQNIFSGYDNAGNQIFPNNPLGQTLSAVRTVMMFVNVQSATTEVNGMYPTVTMTAQGKINNF